MTARRTSWRAVLGTSLLLALTAAVPAAAEEEEGGAIGSGAMGIIPLLEAGPADLLDPIGPVLSGRPWLMSEGLDPGQGGVPASDPLTGFDYARGSVRTQAAGAGAPVPFRDPGPAFSRNILVTRDFSQAPFQTEPHIEVNPNEPEHLVLGVIDYAFPANSAYVSFDGGERWEGPFQIPYLLKDLGAGGDPVIAFDRDDNVYMNFISIGIDEFNLGPIEVAAQVSSIAVAKSEDDGFSWPFQVSAARSSVNTDGLETDRFGRLRGIVDLSFLDKPWMVTGPHPADPEDPERDVIYVTYTEFDLSYEILYIGEIPNLLPTEMRTTIELVASEDGGRTWSEPVAVSPTVRRAFGERGDDSGASGVFGTLRVVQGSQPVVTPDGTVYVAWMDSTDDRSQEGIGEIQVASSSDAGSTWSTPVVASVFNETEFRPRNAFFRFWASSFPQIAAGPNGELYVVYVGRPSDKPNDDGDVFLTISRDGGLNWSRPQVLNDDDTDRVQIFPSVDVSPDGTVHVMWGDMRDDPHETRYHIYYTSSEDGGETFGFVNEELGLSVGDTRVTDFPTNPNYAFPRGLFIGDYFSLAATDEDVYMAWADGRLGEFGPINQKIAFARQKSVPSPQIFISPPSGPGGQEVTIQGFDFQPDMGVFVQLGDSTISTLRTNLDGGFTARVFMPITSEGSQTITVYDESGNGASQSYYTEFGFGNIRQLIEDLDEKLDESDGG